MDTAAPQEDEGAVERACQGVLDSDGDVCQVCVVCVDGRSSTLLGEDSDACMGNTWRLAGAVDNGHFSAAGRQGC